MLDQELLEILVCPETHQPVRPADDELLSRLNQAVEEGELETVGGEPVRSPFEAALVREDGRRVYRVSDGIPIMLIDESIEWRSDDGGVSAG